MNQEEREYLKSLEERIVKLEKQLAAPAPEKKEQDNADSQRQ